MANFIEKAAQINSEIYVNFTSRYTNSSVIYYGDDRKITFTTYKRKDMVESEEDKFMIITTAVEYRPDLVSQKIYFTPDYWWKIMEFNSIYDIADFTAGKTLRLPNNFA
jgi:hypothetical protein